MKRLINKTSDMKIGTVNLMEVSTFYYSARDVIGAHYIET